MHVDHRPWPLPDGEWTSRQTWHDLLFAHWPVPAAMLRPFVPAALEIQEFNGTSWVGFVPFRMTGVTLRGWPPIPGLSAFPEMNLRLYVEHQGRAGVWFVSLDACKRPAVWAARRFYNLPYFFARIRARQQRDRVLYDAARAPSSPPVEFRGDYGPTGPVYQARRGSIDHFLAERYCLYAQDRRGRITTIEIHHDRGRCRPRAGPLTASRSRPRRASRSRASPCSISRSGSTLCSGP
jgi:uncharacterized protein YqjF (DUF2071 family)